MPGRVSQLRKKYSKYDKHHSPEPPFLGSSLCGPKRIALPKQNGFVGLPEWKNPAENQHGYGCISTEV